MPATTESRSNLGVRNGETNSANDAYIQRYVQNADLLIHFDTYTLGAH